MLRTFTCIMCPQGCDITAELGEAGGNPGDQEILSISGNKCPKGKAYVTQEIVAPMRNIATSVLVTGGELPLASVRLTKPIPKERIFDVMAEIRKVHLVAPVEEGAVVIANVLGLGSDVILTRSVGRAE